MRNKFGAVVGLILGAVALAHAQTTPNPQAPAKTPWVVSVVHVVDSQKLAARWRAQGKVRVGVPGTMTRQTYNVTTGLVVDSTDEGSTIVTRLVNLDPQDKEQQISVISSDNTQLAAKLIGVDYATGFAVLAVRGMRVRLPEFAPPAAAAEPRAVKIYTTDFVQKAQTTKTNNTVYFLLTSTRIKQGQIVAPSPYAKARGALPLRSEGLLARNDSSIVTTLDDQVLGIAQYAGFGRAYVFPISAVRDNITRRVIERGGNVPAGWLGASGVGLGELPESEAAAFGLKEKAGVVVREVMPESPAAKAGLQLNDVILAVDGFEVRGRSELAALLGSSPAGRQVRLRVSRNREHLEVEAVLGERPLSEMGAYAYAATRIIEPRPAERDNLQNRLEELRNQYRNYQARPESKERNEALSELTIEILQLQDSLRLLDQQLMEQQRAAAEAMRDSTGASGPVETEFEIGFAGRDLANAPQLAQYFGVKSGVLVTRIMSNSWAAASGLAAGDIIIAAENQVLSSADHLKSLFETAPGTMALTIVRNRQPITIQISRK